MSPPELRAREGDIRAVPVDEVARSPVISSESSGQQQQSAAQLAKAAKATKRQVAKLTRAQTISLSLCLSAASARAYQLLGPEGPNA